MVSQKITTKGKKMLTEEIGEQMIFDDVMAGMPIVRVAKKYNVGTRVFYA
jgi:Mor family transcriptional regulator